MAIVQTWVRTPARPKGVLHKNLQFWDFIITSLLHHYCIIITSLLHQYYSLLQIHYYILLHQILGFVGWWCAIDGLERFNHSSNESWLHSCHVDTGTFKSIEVSTLMSLATESWGRQRDSPIVNHAMVSHCWNMQGPGTSASAASKPSLHWVSMRGPLLARNQMWGPGQRRRALERTPRPSAHRQGTRCAHISTRCAGEVYITL